MLELTIDFSYVKAILKRKELHMNIRYDVIHLSPNLHDEKKQEDSELEIIYTSLDLESARNWLASPDGFKSSKHPNDCYQIIPFDAEKNHYLDPIQIDDVGNISITYEDYLASEQTGI